MLPPTEDDAVAPGSPESDARVVPPERGLAGFRLYWWLSVVIVLVDQLSKAIVRAALPVAESRSVVPGIVDFTHVHNAGVAFGFLNDLAMDGWAKTTLTTALAVMALLGIAFYARHVQHEERVARIGLSLVLGGAVGNLVDRLRVGYVVDFVDVYWRGWHFWAFNVADACITIGAILIFIDLLLVSRHASHPVSDR